MTEENHDPLQCVTQLRQTLSADKLSIGFFLGAGCPCAVRVPNGNGSRDRPLIPDIRGLTTQVQTVISTSEAFRDSYETLVATFTEDGIVNPTVEDMLNRIRSFREVAGKARVRGLSFDALNDLDSEICRLIRDIASCGLPETATPYHALARFVSSHRSPFTEIFTTNYDILIEQALEKERVPFFDGFVGASRPFFDQRAIEDGEIPPRWARLWKLHGSINWRFNNATRAVFRSDADDGSELLIHPSHLKYDESRRMPYFVMIDRLRRFLRYSERPVALILIGYSFRDEHINEAIVESIKASPSAACFALQFGRLSEYPTAIALAKDNSNLSVLAPDEAVIRRRQGKWFAAPTIDMSILKGAFELISEEAEGTGEAPNAVISPDTEAPRPCRMTLGDFRELGDFLNEFSGFYSAAGTEARP